ncbi:MAG: GatB/YqeY domain-containing protein [Eggerthellaceae bacterium]
MKAKDKVRLSILRQVHGEIKNIEVNERRAIEDADVDAMLKRLIKQTKETLDGSIKANNDQERTDTLTEQVSILESYLPKQVSGDELSALIDEVLDETGASTKKDMGRVMGALTQKTGGNFDKAEAASSWARSWPSSPPRIKKARMMRASSLRRLPCPVRYGARRKP